MLVYQCVLVWLYINHWHEWMFPSLWCLLKKHLKSFGCHTHMNVFVQFICSERPLVGRSQFIPVCINLHKTALLLAVYGNNLFYWAEVEHSYELHKLPVVKSTVRSSGAKQHLSQLVFNLKSWQLLDKCVI